MKGFASDNYAGVLPEVMHALHQANEQHAVSYGNDKLTQRVVQLFKEVFETDLDVVFVFNGTGANVLSVSAALNSYNAVLCADSSHFYNDESTAPETFTGCRFIPILANAFGKISAAEAQRKIIRKGDIHFAQPRILSITQSTEYGTVYTADEIKELAQLAHANELLLHVDGARFFNAAASLKTSLADLTTHSGVDMLSLGGTKLGLMYGEAVLVFNKKIATAIRFKQKQIMQLPSKARFIAAQFEAILSEERWRKIATHANAMAQLLFNAIKEVDGVEITMPVEANAVFAKFPPQWIPVLQERFPFYVWNELTHEVRLMCAFDTQETEVAAFAALVKKLATTGV